MSRYSDFVENILGFIANVGLIVSLAIHFFCFDKSTVLIACIFFCKLSGDGV